MSAPRSFHDAIDRRRGASILQQVDDEARHDWLAERNDVIGDTLADRDEIECPDCAGTGLTDSDGGPCPPCGGGGYWLGSI